MSDETEDERAARKQRDADRGYRVLYEQMVDRAAAAEAVIERAREQNTLTNGRPRYRELSEIWERPPSTVLEDRDRETAARAWDEGYGACDVFSSSPPGAPWPRNPYRKGDANG